MKRLRESLYDEIVALFERADATLSDEARDRIQEVVDYVCDNQVDDWDASEGRDTGRASRRRARGAGSRRLP